MKKTNSNPNELTTQIWVLLNKTQREVSTRFDAELKRQGLPNARWYDVLWGLERQGGEQGLRQYELEAISLFDQPNLSRILKQMIAQGLVDQGYAPQDKRGRVLKLTAEGRALRARMWVTYSRLMRELIEQKVEPDLAVHLVKGLEALLSE